MGQRAGLPALVEWSLAFALLALVVMTALSIGVILVPVAVAAFVAAGVRNRVWPYLPFSMFIGVGTLVTVIGFMHLDYVPCGAAGRAIGSAIGRAGAVGRGSCGGLRGQSWLAAGAILALVGVAGYVVLTRQDVKPSVTVDE
jgi:hypothetical protein